MILQAGDRHASPAFAEAATRRLARDDDLSRLLRQPLFLI